MSYKYRVLTKEDRMLLLLLVGILVVLGALFFGTGVLTDKIFPLVERTTPIWLVDAFRAGEPRLFTPGGAIFYDLTAICAVLALTILGYAIFSDLGFLFIPVIIILVILTGSMFASIFDIFKPGNTLYAIFVLGMLVVEVTGLILAIVLIIKKMNYEDRMRSIRI